MKNKQVVKINSYQGSPNISRNKEGPKPSQREWSKTYRQVNEKTM